jgi:hypothetical protein
MMDFLFGRPLTVTIKNYGMRVKQSGKKIRLVAPVQRQLSAD